LISSTDSLPHVLGDELNNIQDKSIPIYYKIFPAAKSIVGFLPFLVFNRLSVTRPRVFGFFKALKDNEGASLPTGVAGYCWGGKFVTLLCQDTEKSSTGASIVDCGFTAHPSLLEVPADVEPVTKPMSVSIGDADFALGIDKVREMERIFKAKDGGGEKFEVTVLPGARHGFAVRGNMEVQAEKDQMESATKQAVDWFGKWLGQNRESKL
jgi:dienelactone hydrolase